MKVNHNEVEIAYNERENKWEAEIRGRFRAFDSLALAKVAIDTGAPEKKEKIERIPILKMAYEPGKYYAGEVTSFVDLAPKRNFGGASGECWVSISGSRSKENVSDVILDTPENRETIASAKLLFEQAAQTKKDAEALVRSCTRVKHPDAVVATA